VYFGGRAGAVRLRQVHLGVRLDREYPTREAALDDRVMKRFYPRQRVERHVPKVVATSCHEVRFAARNRTSVADDGLLFGSLLELFAEGLRPHSCGAKASLAVLLHHVAFPGAPSLNTTIE